MSERLPRVTAKEVIHVLERRGFILSRSSGSHHIYRDPTGIRITIPVHAGKILHPKVLQSILRDMDMTVEELRKALR
ncbi:MAG TPA: type II toxin-antitoxin system HicA family toxin [bacterium]|nr:type II toxin-antitoxin system HicA family toxin [bacterium]HPO08592.1 type II toxin-antitoxin system HicA family toxin [bacterium]HQP98839.1 type II toxin-antitoxin system HicA family toxin [bacterium]